VSINTRRRSARARQYSERSIFGSFKAFDGTPALS
jgi:hypothetical protein